jgi:hypothetical protein
MDIFPIEWVVGMPGFVREKFIPYLASQCLFMQIGSPCATPDVHDMPVMTADDMMEHQTLLQSLAVTLPPEITCYCKGSVKCCLKESLSCYNFPKRIRKNPKKIVPM